MSRQRMRQDQQFWHIVKDLRWKLEDGNHGTFPPGEPEFGYGGGRSAPMWASHVAAFLLGGIAFGLTLVAPAFVPPIAAVGLVGFLLVRRRSRR